MPYARNIYVIHKAADYRFVVYCGLNILREYPSLITAEAYLRENLALAGYEFISNDMSTTIMIPDDIVNIVSRFSNDDKIFLCTNENKVYIVTYPYFGHENRISGGLNNNIPEIRDDIPCIHTYSYKPEPKFHKLDEESTSFLLYMGCEIEVDIGGKSEQNAKVILDKYSDKEKYLYIKYDGSLPNGFEIVTHPMTLNYHKAFNYKEMFCDLIEMGYKAHDTNTCGLHIHINRNYFGEKQKDQSLGILKMLWIFEKFEKQICILSRRKSGYAEFIKHTWSKDADDPLMLFAHSATSRQRRWAINLRNENTIEIRCFKGTLNIDTFFNTLEFVSIVAEISLKESIETVYEMKWKDIEKKFSVPLLEYYQKRVEIEKNKLKDKETHTENNNEISFLNGSHIRAIGAERNDQIFRNHYDNVFVNHDGQGICDGNLSGLESNYASSVELLYNSNSEILSHESKIKLLKKKIKDAKKKKKNSRNYIEQLRLQIDINSMQRDLKILKRNPNYRTAYIDD